MSNFSQQFDGLAHPRPRGGDRGVYRKPSTLLEHSDYGKIGPLSAIAREIGVGVSALAMQKKRRMDFPRPVLGNTYALRDVARFRGLELDD